MLLTITTTHQPATDLGYLLYKNPARSQTFDLTFGEAHVFYPEQTAERCTAALLLDINPIGLVRGNQGFTLSQYVNDRPYVASSFLSVAIAQVYGTALNGTSRERPELAQTAIPLEATVSMLPARGGVSLLEKLFTPLGYTFSAERVPLDPKFPEWGMSPYYTVELSHHLRLAELLSHLYVLIPVLDNDKHYFVGDQEVRKLLAKGGGWLEAHPEKELIVSRYLKHQRSLKMAALDRLEPEEKQEDQTALDAEEEAGEEAALAAAQPEEKPVSLHKQRLDKALELLKASGAERVLDLGCGEGRLLSLLLKEWQFKEILGMDVSHRTLEKGSERLRLDRMPEQKRARLTLIQGSLLYRDARLAGYDAAAVIEVIEHLDKPRLAAFERVLFEFARPQTIVLTTPNREYNVMWPSLPAGQFRHRDHRFEWTRAEFEVWTRGICERFGYEVELMPVGPEDEQAGAPSQLALFQLLVSSNS
ncbi:MAG: 3' terminal RNA ribose 2'-O-methyltransferase Hen1 [Chloroflexota bacterium]